MGLEGPEGLEGSSVTGVHPMGSSGFKIVLICALLVLIILLIRVSIKCADVGTPFSFRTPVLLLKESQGVLGVEMVCLL